MKTAPETIVLIGQPARKEDKAIAAFSPGHLLEFNSTGVRKHSVAKGNSRKAIAVENELLGKTIEDAYAINDNAHYVVFGSGDVGQVRVAAAAPAIVKGDFLESAGDGTFRKITAPSQSGTTPFAVTAGGVALAVALAALDNSGGGSEAFLQVEFL